MSCYKCELLGELYKQVPQTPRNYWVMTELFVFLHGSDVCDGDDEQAPQEQMQQKLRGGWIPVDERLPETGKYIIGATPIDDTAWHIQGGCLRPPEDHDGLAVIETSGGGWHWISHWMSLPSPPKRV